MSTRELSLWSLTMIKNENQLVRVNSRIEKLEQQLNEILAQYSGIELELLYLPISDEIEKLQEEIYEYKSLKKLSLNESIQGLLSEPLLLDNIGELLTKLRIAAGYTQKELASKLGWKQSNISRFENPNYSSQTIAKVIEYANALDVWLQVFPSMTETISKEADTRFHAELNSIIISIGEGVKELPFHYGPVDNTQTSYRPLSRKDLHEGTQTDLLEIQEREYEYA